MIRSLPAEVRARLRSGVTICSFGQCVEELLLNSTDARATCVAIRVDMETFRIQVVDNGSGMGREDVELIGTRYFTSKCHSLGDLENLESSGFRGEAMASIANMSSLVEILSKTSSSAKTFTKLFQNGRALEVFEAEVSRPSVGTTVTVCNLFYNLPVRQRCLNHVLELERTRQKVEAISLMYPAISFSLRNDAAGSMLLQLPKTKDVSSRFCQIYGLSKSQKLRAVHFDHQGFAMSGYIGCEGHYNKNIQFLYVNKRLVLKTRLHKLIDFLLRKESVICKPKAAPSGRQMSPSRHHSGPELHGIYVINVKCSYCDYDMCLEPAKTLIEFKDWGPVLRCIEEGVRTFLNQEHLFMEPSSEDIKEFNEKNDFNLTSAEVQHVMPCGKSVQETFRKACGSIIDSYELTNLKSKAVLRKAAVNTESLDSSTPDDDAGVTQEPTNKKLDSTVCGGGTDRAGLSEPASREGEGAMSARQNECISEAEKVELEEGEGPQNPKLLPASLENDFDLVVCTEAMPDISEEDSCVVTENYVEETVVTQRDCFLDSGLGSHVAILISDDEQEVEGGAAGTAQSDSEIGVGPSFLLERTTSGRCEVYGENTGPHQGLSTNERESGVAPSQIRLCSTGLITHLAAHQVKERPKTTHNSPHLFSKPGPVSAQDIFGANMSVSKQTQNVTKEYANLQSKRVDKSGDYNMCVIHARERSNQGDEGPLLGRHSGGDLRVRFLNALPADSTSSSTSSTKQCVFSKPRAPRKLSLFAQLGSLERFRRWCGKVQRSQSASASRDNRDGSPIRGGLHPAAAEGRAHHSRIGAPPHTCGSTLTAEHAGSKSNVAAALVPENNPCPLVVRTWAASEDPASVHEHVRESPLALADYVKSKQPATSNSKFLSSLATKLSKMRGEQNDTPASARRACSREASLTDSNGSVTCEPLLKSETDIQHCQEPQLSCADVESDNCNSYPSPQNSGEIMGGSHKPYMFINTAGEHMSCASTGLTLEGSTLVSGRDDKDMRVQGGPSQQNLKATEVPADKFPNELDGGPSDTGSRKGIDDLELCSSDWLQRFDMSLGRTVYINTTTGLSSYSAPLEESHAACTKDLTTLAVNVVSRSDVADTTGNGENLRPLFSEWENPVFARCPKVAVDVSSGEATGLAVKIHNILYPYRFTKEMIHSMKVLQQVDNKFIACLINTKSEVEADPDGNLLVLVDQHAAHERIRLEQLIADSYESAPDASSGRRKLLSSTVCPPMKIEVTDEHKRLLRSFQSNLRDVGLELSFPEGSTSHVLVGKVPLCFVEREANEVRRGRPPVTKAIVEEFIREEVEMLQTAGGASGTLPLTVLKVLASQACHGAIKFNNRLSLEECCCLMEGLSWCRLPFQCAHGRPSILPLADVDHLELQKKELPKPNLSSLRKRFRAWQMFGKRENPLGSVVEGAQTENFSDNQLSRAEMCSGRTTEPTGLPQAVSKQDPQRRTIAAEMCTTETHATSVTPQEEIVAAN